MEATVPAPQSVQVTLDLRFLKIAGTWDPTDYERQAAWELYVELATRVGVVPLSEGLSREALASLYSIFSSTRDILRKNGPEIGQSRRLDGLSFGYLAIGMLNGILRPLLSRWHPALADWESRRTDSVSQMEHERAWSRDLELRADLERTGVELRIFLDVLADVCAVPHAIRVPMGG